MSQVSGSHVLGHSHLTRAATPDLCDRGDGATTPDNPSLSGLFPLSDPWYSSHRRHIGRLHSTYSAYYVCPLVEHTPQRVLCRWLAGDSQRIPIPYF